MANRKISDLTALTTPASGDYLPIVDISEAADADKNKRITIEELMRGAPNGTAAAPGIAFEGDPDTGIYSPGADQLALATGGTGRLFVDANGNVGVGSAPGGSAGRVLDINGITLQPILTLRRSSSSTATASIDLDSDNNLVNFVSSDFPVRFYVNGSERLRITSDGKVGLGTSGPQQRLHVNDTSAGSTTTPILVMNRGNASGTAAQIALIATGSDFSDGQYAAIKAYSSQGTANTSHDLAFLTCTNGGTPTERLYITRTGNVGVGTTGPNYALDVRTTGTSISSSFTSDQTEQYIALKDLGTTLGHVRLGSTSGAMLFYAGNGERARIDSSGRLLVGTSSDSGGALLQVNGNRIRVGTAKTPASATDTGTAGEICWDANYVYVCTATNTWKRSALSTW